MNPITSEAKKSYFVKGQVSQLHLKDSALYQVLYSKWHGLFQIVVFLQLPQRGIRSIATVVSTIHHFCEALVFQIVEIIEKFANS